MQVQDFEVKAGNELLAGTINYGRSRRAPNVISLHGGGPSDRKKTGYLSEHLAAQDKTAVRFDFSGHGKSSGSIRNSSLAKRLAETRSVVDQLKFQEPLTVIGTSMGGHIASLLTRFYKVGCLILFCPAAYDSRAFDIPFSGGFGYLIRRAGSYENSEVFESLAGYRGKSAIIIGTKDEVVPQAVIGLYEQALKNSPVSMTLRLSNCPHQIHGWLEKNPSVQEFVLQSIDSLCG